MIYWVLMGLLIIIAIILITIIVVALMKQKRDVYNDENEMDGDEDYGGEGDYDDEEEYQPRRSRKQGASKRDGAGVMGQEASHRQRPKKKLWKVLMENLDTWEKFSFTFYDSVGIGRVEDETEFEKYLVVDNDPRVSKVHCEIFRREDKLYLRDMGSRNGTYLNGERVEKPVVIQKEDIIGVGGTKIEVKKVLRERD